MFGVQLSCPYLNPTKNRQSDHHSTARSRLAPAGATLAQGRAAHEGSLASHFCPPMDAGQLRCRATCSSQLFGTAAIPDSFTSFRSATPASS